MKGLGWKVGNGQSIYVWNDHWIPTREFFKPFVNYSNIWSDLKMVQLMDSRPVHWNQELINKNFHLIHAQRILTIPIQSQNVENLRI